MTRFDEVSFSKDFLGLVTSQGSGREKPLRDDVFLSKKHRRRVRVTEDPNPAHGIAMDGCERDHARMGAGTVVTPAGKTLLIGFSSPNHVAERGTHEHGNVPCRMSGGIREPFERSARK